MVAQLFKKYRACCGTRRFKLLWSQGLAIVPFLNDINPVHILDCMCIHSLSGCNGLQLSTN